MLNTVPYPTIIDFTKAFDRVNYWLLFNQLLDDGVDLSFVHILVYWYTNQQARVRWNNTVSSKFFINNEQNKKEFYPRTCLLVTFATCLLQSQNVVLDAVSVAYLPIFFLTLMT